MEFNQEITVAAPREKVWDFIWQVEEFASCVPGVKDVEKNRRRDLRRAYRAEGQFPEGEFFSFRSTSRKSARPSTSAQWARGRTRKSRRASSRKNEVTLEAVSENETKVCINSSVDVFGKLGSLGFTVIKNQANKIFAEFAKNVKAKVE